MGEIGSRAIHRCVVVFLSLSLVGRTMRARVCVGFKALVVSRLKEIRARDERERFRKRQFRSAREKRSHRRLVGPPKTRFVCELFSTFQSPKEAKSADDECSHSFARPLFSVALACFCLLTNTFSLSLFLSLVTFVFS